MNKVLVWPTRNGSQLAYICGVRGKWSAGVDAGAEQVEFELTLLQGFRCAGCLAPSRDWRTLNTDWPSLRTRPPWSDS